VKERTTEYNSIEEFRWKEMEECMANIAYLHAGVQHEVEKLSALVEAKVEVVESLIAELSPALAVHTGPGMTGLCYYPVES
jgi:fatty acid-binding protein DegV